MMKQGIETWIVIPEPLPIYQRLMPKLRTPLRARKYPQKMETCQLKGKRVVNPIIDWKDADVLVYAAVEKICMNPLYGCGWKRVGCIGCPLASKNERRKEFARYPKHKLAYIRAFSRMLSERKKRGLDGSWKTGEDVFHTWMEDGVLPGQIVFDGMEEDTL